MRPEAVHPIYVLLVLVSMGFAFYWAITVLRKTRGDRRTRTTFKRMGVLASTWLLIVIPCMVTAAIFEALGLH